MGNLCCIHGDSEVNQRRNQTRIEQENQRIISRTVNSNILTGQVKGVPLQRVEKPKIQKLTSVRDLASPKCLQDITEVQRNFTSLKPKVDNFHFNDGRSQKLICLKGTIPISYW